MSQALKNVREQRVYSLAAEVRAEGDADAPTIVGYAAKFDRESQDLGGFVEVIRRGAFTRAVEEDDVRALLNHDANYVLGRSKSGTLRMAEDSIGLRIEVDVPDAQWARDLYRSIERGDIDQMSFAFRVVKDAWTQREGQAPDVLRELLDVRLYDVSPVTYPAYHDTEVGVRSVVADRDLSDSERDALRSVLGEPAQDDIPSTGRTVAELHMRLALAERAV